MSNIFYKLFNVLRANPTKWSNTLKQFVGNLPTNCLCVFDYFVGLALKGLTLVKLLDPEKEYLLEEPLRPSRFHATL